jgi:hypothetical protein
MSIRISNKNLFFVFDLGVLLFAMPLFFAYSTRFPGSSPLNNCLLAAPKSKENVNFYKVNNPLKTIMCG